MLRLSYEFNGKMMELESDIFKFRMEIERLAVDLYLLGDKPVTELRKCEIIVTGLSTDYEIECCKLKINPADLDKAEIERVAGNQHN